MCLLEAFSASFGPHTSAAFTLGLSVYNAVILALVNAAPIHGATTVDTLTLMRAVGSGWSYRLGGRALGGATLLGVNIAPATTHIK